jgi:hypothetical protein
MDQDTIQKIAQEVVKHLPSYSWQLLVVQAVLTLLAFGGGALFGEYLKTKGKNLASKADFDGLQDQLRGTSKLVETVKADIGQEDWRTREWANLRRIKLEALLNNMHDCERYLDQLRNRAFEAAPLEERDPLPGLEVITTLYFPELKIEVDAYLDKCRARRAIIIEALSETKKLDAPLPPSEEFGPDLNCKEFEAVRGRLSAAARNLTIQIMGVGE